MSPGQVEQDWRGYLALDHNRGYSKWFKRLTM
jgi:hypothetical protein